jgi:multimeric flavodoxin WrbA
MFVLAVNGSPRKKWNTATLLEHALKGAASKGAQTELVHLYDLQYTGCTSCFACKKIGGKSYGKCAVKDGLTPLLQRAAGADALILGSPVYFRAESGEMRSFMERLMFPYLTYTPGYQCIAPRKIPTAFLYSMNVPAEHMVAAGVDRAIEASRQYLERVFGSCETLASTDTLQFTDYSKYLSTAWDPAAKARRRKEIFPQDCASAFAIGERLAQQAAE